MKKKLLLPIYLGLSVVLIIAAVVMSLTVGVNLGVDFNGGTKFEIKLADDVNTKSYESKINSVLDDYGYVIDSYLSEDRYDDEFYTFKINEKSIAVEKQAEIRTKIAEKLSIDVSNISEAKEISGNVTQKNLISISIAVACVFLVFVFVGWARYGIMEGLSLMFVGLHNAIISFAILIITTLQINIPTIVAVLACTLVSLGIFAYILERNRELKNSSQGKEMTDYEIYRLSSKKSFANVVIFAIAAVVFAISCVFSSMHFIRLFAISLVACTLVAVYSSNAIGVELGAMLSNIATTSEKQSLSKNVETKKSTKK